LNNFAVEGGELFAGLNLFKLLPLLLQFPQLYTFYNDSKGN